MGRFGGRELGFGSDADVMYVFRAVDADHDAAHTAAQAIVSELDRLTEDNRLPLDLDIGLRPEGKNGPAGALARLLPRLLRALVAHLGGAGAAARPRRRRRRGAARRLRASWPTRCATRAAIGEQEVREVRRIKARVENERLPQGADPHGTSSSAAAR